MRTTSSSLSIRGFVFAIVTGAFALAGCAVDPTDDGATQSQELASNGGGGGGQSFQCNDVICWCSKTIAGDCDGMGDVCFGGPHALDECMKNPYAVSCSCPLAVASPPAPTSPIRAKVPTRAVTTR